MQVSVESTGTLERTVKVEVPEEKVATEVENRLKSLSKTTKLQGFRPGKVPFKIIRQRFSTQVRQEVVGEVVQSSFFEAIQKENLQPAGRPEIDSLESDLGKGVIYTAKFEVLPEVKLATVGDLAIEKVVCEISEEDIDKMIDVLKNQRKESQEVDRTSTAEDIVDIDFKGNIEGESFEGGESAGFEVELDKKRLIDGFEAGLIGKKAGDEFCLSLTFPADYHVEDLAGKPVEFQVTVNKVLEPVLPELNDEFFRAFGVEDGGLEAFRLQMKTHMERESEAALRIRNRDAVMDALHSANKIALPNILVEQEKQRIKEQLSANLKAQGIPVDEVNNADDDSLFKEQANKRVSLQLIVSELIKEQDLKADPAKVRAMIEKSAEGYNDPSEIVNWYYSDKNRLAEMEAVVLEGEVVDWALESANITEVNMAFDELMNKGQTETV